MKEVIGCFGYRWCIEHTPKNNGLKVTFTIMITQDNQAVIFTL